MQNEREIDALLSPGEAGSIIDRLMAMPHPKDGTPALERMGSRGRQPLRDPPGQAMRSQIDGDHQNAA